MAGRARKLSSASPDSAPERRQNMAKNSQMPGVGLDVGTANIVVCRMDKDGNFVNTTHRNMLYELEESDDSADLLKRGDYLYAKCDGKYYVIGKDALSLVNALGTGTVSRPMKDGLLNPQLKRSQELLFHIIRALIGKPAEPGESVRFSLPANPVDHPERDNTFHGMVIQKFLQELGYDANPLNEGMAVIYDCNPVMKLEGGAVDLTGFGISMGGGMFNVAGAYKGLPVCEFSITKSGDYIDQQASEATGVPVNKVTKIKETRLDLSKVDYDDRVLTALSIYYDEAIGRALVNIRSELAKTDRDFEGPCEIVVAGGTALIPGVTERFKPAVAKAQLPFEVLDVRLSKNPFHSVAQGLCMRAAADWKKKNP
jgi:hypothetical protein